MLYRLFASIWGSTESEVTVFFEPPPGQKSAADWAGRMLGQLWHVPCDDVEVYNVEQESELLARANGPQRTGDARLLETGMGGGDVTRYFVHYARPEHTLLLVRPATLERLVKAQQFAASLNVYYRTERGQQELDAHWAAQLQKAQAPA